MYEQSWPLEQVDRSIQEYNMNRLLLRMRLHSIVAGKSDEWNKYAYSLDDYQKDGCNKKTYFAM